MVHECTQAEEGVGSAADSEAAAGCGHDRHGRGGELRQLGGRGHQRPRALRLPTAGRVSTHLVYPSRDSFLYSNSHIFRFEIQPGTSLADSLTH